MFGNVSELGHVKLETSVMETGEEVALKGKFEAVAQRLSDSEIEMLELPEKWRQRHEIEVEPSPELVSVYEAAPEFEAQT